MGNSSKRCCDTSREESEDKITLTKNNKNVNMFFTFKKVSVLESKWEIYKNVQFNKNVANNNNNNIISALIMFKKMIKNPANSNTILLDDEGKILFLIEINKNVSNSIIYQEPYIPPEKIVSFHTILVELLYPIE